MSTPHSPDPARCGDCWDLAVEGRDLADFIRVEHRLGFSILTRRPAPHWQPDRTALALEGSHSLYRASVHEAVPA